MCMMVFGTDLTVIGNNQHRPAFIQQGKKFTDISICLQIHIFQSWVYRLRSILHLGLLIFEILDDHVALQVNIVEMGKDDLQIVGLNEVI